MFERFYLRQPYLSLSLFLFITYNSHQKEKEIYRESKPRSFLHQRCAMRVNKCTLPDSTFYFRDFFLLAFAFGSLSALCLDVDYLGQLLDLVQQCIALLDRRLVLRVLLVHTRRHHNASHLVNLAVQPLCCDELRELSVNKVGGHAKRLCHRVERDGSVPK